MKIPMTCTCCGGDAGYWEQHWNRDAGYGACVSCIEWVKKTGYSQTDIENAYGVEGVNWGNDDEK